METHRTTRPDSDSEITRLTDLERQFEEIERQMRPLTDREIDAMARALLSQAGSAIRADEQVRQQPVTTHRMARRGMAAASATLLVSLAFFGGYCMGANSNLDTYRARMGERVPTTYFMDVAGGSELDKVVRYETQDGLPEEEYVVEVDGLSVGYHGQYPRLDERELSAYPRSRS